MHRAIAALSALSDADLDLSLTSIAARTGLPVSTTYRPIQSLLVSGLIERSESGDGYRLGLGLVATPALQRVDAHNVTRRLQSLTLDIEITGSFGVALGDDLLTLFSARPLIGFCENQLPGRHQPLAQSAMGMALLSTQSGFGQPALKLVRRRGYADAIGRQGQHVRAIAVPVILGDGDVWGAIGVQASRRRLTDEVLHQILPVIRGHANHLSAPVSTPPRKTSS